jgi:glycosyltransferase involved in cell wall biosynthesis
MRVALIATMLNEAGNLRPFLEALLAQTRRPDEILLCDGGSEDGSLEIIREYIRAGTPIQLISAPGANIARGRNLAIREAGCEIVAVTDAGCRADPRWLEEITAPFEDATVAVASGFSLAAARNRIEESFGIITLGDIRAVDPAAFSPSSRSIAFRRSAWEKAGGYPEELDYAEDSLFNRRLRESGARFVFSSKALVQWLPPTTVREAARKFYLYGRGDGRAGLSGTLYARIFLKAGLVLGLAAAGFACPICWAVLALSFGAYFVRQILVNRRRAPLAVNCLVFVHRILLDGARLAGYLAGKQDRWLNPAYRHLR